MAEHERRAVPPAAVQRVLQLGVERDAAQARLQAYLEGLAYGLGVDPARVAGLDEQTCELLLTPDASGQ